MIAAPEAVAVATGSEPRSPPVTSHIVFALWSISPVNGTLGFANSVAAFPKVSSFTVLNVNGVVLNTYSKMALIGDRYTPGVPATTVNWKGVLERAIKSAVARVTVAVRTGLGPVGPVAPEPVAPVGPGAEEVGPVGPVAPVAPVGPVIP